MDKKKNAARPKGRAKKGFSAELFKDGSVYIGFKGSEVFTPGEFTAVFVPILEAYTEQLLVTNSRQKVYNLWNEVFGLFLNSILSEDEIYTVSDKHKKFKEELDEDLEKKDDKELKIRTEMNRLAAVGVSKHLLMKAGLTEESATKLIQEEIFDGPKTVGDDIELPTSVYSDKDEED